MFLMDKKIGGILTPQKRAVILNNLFSFMRLFWYKKILAPSSSMRYKSVWRFWFNKMETVLVKICGIQISNFWKYSKSVFILASYVLLSILLWLTFWAVTAALHSSVWVERKKVY